MDILRTVFQIFPGPYLAASQAHSASHKKHHATYQEMIEGWCLELSSPSQRFSGTPT